MIYITGDTHGEQSRFTDPKWFDRILAKDDTLIICGDFGYIFRNDEEEKAFLEYLAAKPYRILFVDGNHENFDALSSYEEIHWMGGRVHIIASDEAGTPKVIHLMRGQVFTLEGKTIFTFGGGYSIDKAYRTPHRSWWPQEMPTGAEMREGLSNLDLHDNQVDCILTHAAPERLMNRLFPHHAPEKPLNEYLELIRQKVTFSRWYFGHLHFDDPEAAAYPETTMLWYGLYTIDGRKVYSP